MLRSVTDLDLWQTHHMYDPLQGLLQHQWGAGDGMPPCFVLILLNNTQFSPGVFGHVCMECKLGLFLLQIRKKLHKWIIVHVIQIWPASTSVIKCAWQFLSGVCISQFCLRITVMLREQAVRGQMCKPEVYRLRNSHELPAHSVLLNIPIHHLCLFSCVWGECLRVHPREIVL